MLHGCRFHKFFTCVTSQWTSPWLSRPQLRDRFSLSGRDGGGREGGKGGEGGGREGERLSDLPHNHGTGYTVACLSVDKAHTSFHEERPGVILVASSVKVTQMV